MARFFDDGHFKTILSRRIAVPSVSQGETLPPALHAYLSDEMIPELSALGFSCRIVANPIAGGPPFLFAERREDPAALTLLTYGHGDVVHGYDAQWRAGLAPWTLVEEGDRWYGRGTADNKGQHTVNFCALAQVLAAREGKLGYNVKIVFEMGEEAGSPGLREVCQLHADELAADLFIASDGPRVAAAAPTLFLGSRGVMNFELSLDLRASGHHSGNWGGLLRNPGIRLAHALASLVDKKGRILLPALLPDRLPQNVRDALKSIDVGQGPNDPAVDPEWGEPGLTPSERVFGWNSMEVLAFKTGNPEAPANAVPGNAKAYCQIRFVVGSDRPSFIKHIRAHLDSQGFDDVVVKQNGEAMDATRLDPSDAWVDWCLASMRETTGKTPTLLPNLGGSLPNDVFSGTLGLPTLWVPHSYPACSQHAPNEHLLASVGREALQIMAGLFWDLGEDGTRIRQARQSA